MNEILDTVLEAVYKAGLIQVEVSKRHIHLCQTDLERLFGLGAELTLENKLPQSSQFLAKEKLTLIGPKGAIKNVAIIGPLRKETQVELSNTDCAELGVNAPTRVSGNLEGSAPILLENTERSIEIRRGCIVAKNHIHMTPESAAGLGIFNKQFVGVKLLTDRQIIFPDVLIRISREEDDRMHIDLDEANAGGVKEVAMGQIYYI